MFCQQSCTPVSFQNATSPCFHKGPSASREYSGELSKERRGVVRMLGKVFIKEVKRMLRFADENISKIKTDEE